MRIRTKRLELRPTNMSFLASTHSYASDVENTRFMMFLPYDSLDETRKVISEAEQEWEKDLPHYREFVILKDGEHIGGMTLYFLENRSEGELGWVLRKEEWGMGYAAEAAAAMLDYAKKNCGMERVIACCDSENHASRRVMEKLGMQHCATGKRKNRSMEGERIELIYEIFI